jgi:hypothetical protein
MTVKQRCISLESPAEWKETLSGIKHAFSHTWEHCYAMHLTDGLKTYLYSFEKDGIRIVCPFSEREYGGHIDIVKPFGFSGFIGNGFCPEFYQHWKQFVEERGYVCGYLSFNPVFDFSSNFDSKEVYQYGVVYTLDLTPGLDELIKNMDRNRRRQVRKFDEVKSRFITEKPVLKEFFLKNYFDFLRDKNAPSFYYFSDETISRLFDLDNVIAVGVQESEKIVTVMVFVHTADTGSTLFLVSLPEGRSYSTLLYWYVVTHLKSLGIPTLNLGGGDGDRLDDYKQRFGCKAMPLKCLKQVYRPDIYETLCRQAGADFRDMTGYFPAYRREKSS